MERLIPGAAVTVVALLILLAMVWAWRARTRRQSAFRAPVEAPDVESRGAVRNATSVLYVATTKAGEPLERLTIPGLAFRGRGVVTVYDRGVSISIRGEPETFIDRAVLSAVGTSTWAIDRVVETGGLVRFDWVYTSTDGPVPVESYVRAIELGDARRLIDAADSLAPQGTTPQQEGTSS